MEAARKVGKVLAVLGCLTLVGILTFPLFASSAPFERRRAYASLLKRDLRQLAAGRQTDSPTLAFVDFPQDDPRAARGLVFMKSGETWQMKYLFSFSTRGSRSSSALLSGQEIDAISSLCKSPPPSTDEPQFRRDQVIAWFAGPNGSERRIYTQSTLPAPLRKLVDDHRVLKQASR